jgi:hypothetical protein
MAGIATLTIDDTLFSLRANWLYTLARLMTSPHTAAFVPDFKAVGDIIDDALKTQSKLEDATVLSAAARDAADDNLDPLMIQILNAILVITKNDRSDPLYISYAGTQTGAEIVRAVLGPELVVASEWVDPLQNETEPGLLAFAAPLEEAVKIGKAAEKDVKAADKALADFRLLGPRKKSVDALNAARGSLLGALIKFQHEHSELRLPKDWATSFFRHEVKGAKYGSTVAQAEAYLTALDQDKAAAQAELEVLQKKEADYEEAKAKRAAARLALAEIKKAAKAKKQEEKALKTVANKKLKKK